MSRLVSPGREPTPLEKLWTSVRNYFDLRQKDAGAHAILLSLRDLSVRANMNWALATPRTRVTVGLTTLAVLLLLAHSGNTLLTVLAVLAGVAIVAGWVVYELSGQDDDLVSIYEEEDVEVLKELNERADELEKERLPEPLNSGE